MFTLYRTVPDPLDKAGGGGGGVGGGRVGGWFPKTFFSALQASVSSKNKGAGSPGPFPGSTAG